MMIGRLVSATVWHVAFRYRNDEPPPRILLPGDHRREPEPYKAGEANVLTADPTGADLHRVAELAVRGRLDPAAEFTLTHACRVCDVTGLARVEERKD
jgi:hypothetical protein